MSNIIKKINKEIAKIAEIAISDTSNSTNRAISMFLMSTWRKKKELDKIGVLSAKLNISVSSISKFLTRHDIVNFQVLKYFFQINSETTIDESPISSKLLDTSKSLIKAKRILLIATGNTALIARVFYTNLILKEYNAIFLEGSIDQVKIAKKMDSKDVTIIFSFSMEHEWMKNIYQKSNSKTILFTSNPLIQESENKEIIRIDRQKLSNGKREDFSQTVHLQKYLDIIFRGL